MIVLGIETATTVCGAALLRDGKLVAEYRLNIKNIHARKLAEAVERLYIDTELSSDDLDAIGVSIGPGSFTGLRIGLSLAKGLAMPRSLPLVPVPTLQALASQAPVQDGMICPVLRSRAGEYYTALFRRHADTDEPVEDTAVLKSAEMADFIPAHAAVIGDVEELKNEISPERHLFWVPSHHALLSGFTIARLGAELFVRGQVEELDRLEPRYHQEFIAGKPKRDLPYG